MRHDPDEAIAANEQCAALEERLRELLEDAKALAMDPLHGMDNPGYVIRCMILDACKLFFELTGQDAKVVGITPAMEALLSTKDPDFRRIVASKGKLRGWPTILGLEPRFDVPRFFLR